MSEMVRIRLDLPDELYYRAKAAVQYLRAQKNPDISSLSSLISRVLSEWIEKHVVFHISQGNAKPDVKEVEVK